MAKQQEDEITITIKLIPEYTEDHPTPLALKREIKRHLKRDLGVKGIWGDIVSIT